MRNVFRKFATVKGQQSQKDDRRFGFWNMFTIFVVTYYDLRKRKFILVEESGKFNAMRIGRLHLSSYCCIYRYTVRREVVAYFIAGHTRASLHYKLQPCALFYTHSRAEWERKYEKFNYTTSLSGKSNQVYHYRPPTNSYHRPWAVRCQDCIEWVHWAGWYNHL